jgi:4,4'-diaponeurosporenoate glycosyltransferase
VIIVAMPSVDFAEQLRLGWDLVPYGIGWLAGWFLLWGTRPLPQVTPGSEPHFGVSIIVPARNEQHALPHLLGPLMAGIGSAGSEAVIEVLVVDDHSSDATAQVAIEHGARVIHPPPLPDGWLGKPHACWVGAQAATHDLLVFCDADLHPPSDLPQRMAAALTAYRGQVVSVQPWHTTVRPDEQLSMIFNLVALMGVGRFSLLGQRVTPKAAFGPVLGMDRETYDRIGGHAHPAVRGQHTEDIAIARQVGAAQLFTGAPDISFRMYPGGIRDLIRGWTRSLATGARSGPWWATMLTIAWVASLVGGIFVSPWLYLVSAAQLAVLGPRAGRFSLWMAALYPLAVAVFLIVFVRSAIKVILRQEVQWKSRQVPAR